MMMRRGISSFIPSIYKQRQILFHSYQTMKQEENTGEKLIKQYNVLQYDPGKIVVTSYINKGFNIGIVRVLGSVILTPYDFFCWNVQTPEDITIESLQFFEYMNPTPRILIIGTGKDYISLDIKIRNHFKSVGIVIEEMSTVRALSTFNILNQEDRNVACALLTLEPLDATELTPDKNPTVFIQIEELAKSDPISVLEKKRKDSHFH
jgi:NADH dehydrogenase [ubiquinone] 1 alpha subcomplex assembly factor 3